ncbi:MAG: cache domain-containing protein [Fibrobacterota bacterium]
MKAAILNQRLFLSYLLLIGVTGLLLGLLGMRVIRNDIVRRAQREVRHSLVSARNVYNSELRAMASGLRLADPAQSVERMRVRLGLDYLRSVPAGDSGALISTIAQQALRAGECAGTRLIDSAELDRLGGNLAERAGMDIRATTRATGDARTRLTGALAIETALRLDDASGRAMRVLYGGRLLNRCNRFADRIRDLVFEDTLYAGRPLGTVTFFQGSIRVATNVLDEQGGRALGTRISDVVNRTVLQEGRTWADRAFVVTDWYLTAYEPLRDIRGNVIGALYVGALEKPYTDRKRSLLFAFAGILAACSGLAVLLSLLLSRAEARLKRANAQLTALNRTYLDLVDIVSHELKGILAPMVLNTGSVRDGHLGPVNEAQQQALNAVVRNLDYFESTVRHFLNVSRIEKGELTLSPVRLRLREDILLLSLSVFESQAWEKGMTLLCTAPDNLVLEADAALLQMTVNNLLANAVKYGKPGGRILLDAEDLNGQVRLTVYNDGRPLTPAESGALFRAYTRLATDETKGVRGTGLGLYLSRHIAERHGGTLVHTSGETGNSFILTLKKQTRALRDT